MKDVYPDCDLPCGGQTPCFCALEAFHAECEGIMPMRTGCGVKSLPRKPEQTGRHFTRREVYLTAAVVAAWSIGATALVLQIFGDFF